MRAFELQQLKRAKNALMTRLGLDDKDTRKREYTLARGALGFSKRQATALINGVLFHIQ
jgi:hypothetical protein